jgi:hypothetical protein
MTVSITEIVNSSIELAAFPSSGDVAFFISGPIDNISKRIAVVKKNAIKPNLAASIYTQLGRVTEDYSPDYSIAFDEIENKVTIKLSGLVPAEDYVIIFNPMDSYGDLVSSTALGAGEISLENYNTNIDYTSVNITAFSDSLYISGEQVFSTPFTIEYSNGDTIVRTIKFSEPLSERGMKISVDNSPFISGDTFRYEFQPVSNSDIEIIDIRTSSITSSAQILEETSRRASELDLIAFYEERDAPVSPEQPTKVRRILKSPTSMIIDFTEAVDLNLINFNISSGPAFNALSIPEEEWATPIRATVRQLSPTTIIVSFTPSEIASHEIIKDV